MIWDPKLNSESMMDLWMANLSEHYKKMLYLLPIQIIHNATPTLGNVVINANVECDKEPSTQAVLYLGMTTLANN